MTTDDNIEASKAPLIEHLAELRTRLMKSVIALVLGLVFCLFFQEQVVAFLSQPLLSIRPAQNCWCSRRRNISSR